MSVSMLITVTVAKENLFSKCSQRGRFQTSTSLLSKILGSKPALWEQCGLLGWFGAISCSKYDGSRAPTALVDQEEHFKVYCKMWLSLLFPVRSAAALWINWRLFKELNVTSGTSKCCFFLNPACVCVCTFERLCVYSERLVMLLLNTAYTVGVSLGFSSFFSVSIKW